MLLFKAIKYSGDNCLNSYFQESYKYDSSAIELIEAAMGHVKVANQKRSKRDSDYWISATYDFNTALRYLNDHKDGVYGYNGIACIELPNTHKMGYIYDNKLREDGYIEKRCLKEGVELDWMPNEDGVIWLLDMSNEYTINYLASLMWLKGNDSTFRDLRVLRTSIKDNEVLMLLEDTKFNFIDIETANKLASKIPNTTIKPANWHEELYSLLLYYAPESELKDDIVLQELRNIFDEYDYDDNLIDNREYRISEFYRIIAGSYSKKNAIRRFDEYHKLDYADKEIIEFERYEPITFKYNIEYNKILAAYLHACLNTYEVMKENDKFTVLAHLYKKNHPELFNKDILDYIKRFNLDDFQFGKFSD